MPRKIRFIVIPISILAILLLLLLLFLITTLIKPTLKRSQKHPYYHNLHLQNHLQLAQSHCDGTLYRDLCISTVSTMPDLHNKSLAEVLRYTIRATEAEVKASVANVSGLESGNWHNLSRLQDYAVKDCLELLDESSDELQTVLGEMAGQCGPAHNLTNMLTFLSGVMTNQYTCLDGFADGSDTNSMALRRPIEAGLYNISRHVSNSLSMLKKIRGPNHCMGEAARSSSSSYDDLAAANRMDRAGFPGWMTRKDRRLLQAAVPPGSGSGTEADLVVAKDGSGDCTTVGEAVEAAPKRSRRRFVIYIKEGAYFENVEVGKKKTNIMLVGDGIGKTIIKANRNVADGYTTFRSATVAVVGAGFIAKGITVENYAGPTKHQAVALRSDSDFSAFYQCSFIAYQDTLYTHSLRQFYRECDVYGTVDFIFGNAAVVFQNCNLYAREPLPKQKNMYTAQGRKDPNQNTGISILNCKVAAAVDLAANQTAYKTFLGRPWKEYSRTVFMLSDIHDLVDPAGWLEWSGEFALDTLYYGEYMNTGPGASTDKRVTWPGFRVINSSTEASAFTVRNFIEGDEWLPSYHIPFYPNLRD